MMAQTAAPQVIERVKCAECPIRHRAVCARCDDDELAALDAIKFYKSYEPGAVIALREDPLAMLSSVVSGVATLTQSIEDGRTQMVGLLFPSDFIGRPGRATLRYDVTAATPVTLCCFHRRPFERLMAETPHIQDRFLEMTLDELDAARDWMFLLGRKTAREKIASLLMLIRKRSHAPSGSDPGAPATVELPITREAIADYLGLTIETVSRQISAMRKDGVIDLDGKRTIVICDLAALYDETADDADGAVIA